MAEIFCRGRRRFGARALLSLLAPSVGFPAGAADAPYPQRTIRLVVPFAAGQVTDWTGRLVAEHLAPELGQSIFVDNKAGASGTLGAAHVATQAPDGYTLMMASNGTHSAASSLFNKLAYDPLTSFVSIGGVMRFPWMLMVHPDFPARDMASFVAYARSRPGQLSLGYGAASARLAIHQLRSLARLDIVEVPYKALGQTITDVRGGQLHATFLDMGSAMAQDRGGVLRALGVTSPQRSAVAPDKPSLAETIPGFDMVSWLGLCAPAQTSPAIVRRVHGALQQVLQKPEVRERIAQYGGEPMPIDGPAMTDLVRREIPVWARFVKEASVAPE